VRWGREWGGDGVITMGKGVGICCALEDVTMETPERLRRYDKAAEKGINIL